MSAAYRLVTLSVLCVLWLAGCVVTVDSTPPGTECTPGESFAVDCNTCECSDTGLIADSKCTEMLCTCSDVSCPALPASCLDGVAFPASEEGVCDPDTGNCDYSTSPPGEDCTAIGLVCDAGACVEAKDLCADVTCPGTEAVCTDGVAYPAQADGVCDAKTGECQYPPGLPPEDCTADRKSCVDGACVEVVDPCKDVFCPGTAGSCKDGIAQPGNPGGECVDGECVYPATPEAIDCAADGLVCEAGQCVEPTGCGGFAGFQCEADEFCDIQMCGADMMGICVPGSDICPAIYEPVCGCDGITYGNDCERLMNGTAFDYVGECQEPFACEPMDATGVGACAAFFGYAWNGESCVGISGCNCDGVDCALTYDSPEDCEKDYAACLTPSILAESCNDAAFPSDPYDINDAFIMGDMLYLTVQYGGGCQTHEFPVCYGEFMPAGIDKVELTVGHNANNDMCKALVSQTLEIDLTDMRMAYELLYGTELGAINITVDGWPEIIGYQW